MVAKARESGDDKRLLKKSGCLSAYKLEVFEKLDATDSTVLMYGPYDQLSLPRAEPLGYYRR